MPQYTKKAQNALSLAKQTAKELRQNYIGTEHILLGLLREDTGVAARVLQNNGVEESKLISMINDLIAPGNFLPVKERDGFTPRAEKILQEAALQAQRFKSEQIGTEHILLSVLKEGDNVAVRLLNTIGIQIQKLYVDTLLAMGQDGNLYKEDLGYKGKKKKDKNASTETLDQFSRDLTALAREGRLDPVIGRESEIRRVIQILSRRTKNNPCLVGEPGVGKTAIAEGLAIHIAEGVIPERLKDKRVVTLDL